MRVYKKVSKIMPEILNLPDITMPGVPIIEIYGNHRALIEGRCTVVEYGGSCVKMHNACGTVCICGDGLAMAELSQFRTIITGHIESISISGR